MEKPMAKMQPIPKASDLATLKAQAARELQAELAAAIHDARGRGFGEAEISAALARGIKLPWDIGLELIRDPGRSWH
jgi:hypothetical protein